MPGLLPDVDPDGLLEFSVVYTDRALNHMSRRFVGVMQDILATLKEVYRAHTAVLVPGSGTFGMEAVARQFANRETLRQAPEHRSDQHRKRAPNNSGFETLRHASRSPQQHAPRAAAVASSMTRA